MSAFYIGTIRRRYAEMKACSYEQYMKETFKQEHQRARKERIEQLAASAMKVQQEEQYKEGFLKQQKEHVSQSNEDVVRGKRKRR